MKTPTRRMLAGNITVSLAMMAGCASHNYETGNATASGLKASADKIAVAQSQLDTTLAALNDLVNNPQPDLRPQYRKFSDGVNTLGSLAEHVKSSVAAMRENGDKFFAKWNEQLATIRNEDLRNLSAERRQQVSTDLQKVKQSYTELEVAFKPLMSDLRDVQKYLGTDLTADGAASMTKIAAKVNADSSKLKASVAKLTADFKKLGLAMAAVPPVITPAPTPVK